MGSSFMYKEGDKSYSCNFYILNDGSCKVLPFQLGVYPVLGLKPFILPSDAEVEVIEEGSGIKADSI